MNYLKRIESYVKNFMQHAGHSYSHIRRVYTLVKKVSDEMNNVDEEVLYPATLLHDIARENEFKTGECHAKVGSKWASDYLKSINYPISKIPLITSAIKTHRYSNGMEPETIEGKILQECDRLDAMGAIGVIRTTLHSVDKQPYHINDPLAKNRQVNDFKYGLDHFLFKILKLKDTITIPSVKEHAVKRHEFMIKLLNQVEDDLVNNNGIGSGVKIIQLIREHNNLPYYDEINPFQEGNDTLVGVIMKYKNEKFINDFLQELESEIL